MRLFKRWEARQEIRYARKLTGKADTPPAPDYVGAAQAQGAANVDTARVQGQLNNPNVVTPLGTQTVDFGTRPDTTTFDQAGYDNALKMYQTSLNSSGGNPSTPYSYDGQGRPLDNNGNLITGGSTSVGPAPDINSFYRTIPGGSGDHPTVTQSLTPQGQARFDQEQRIIQALGGQAENQLGRVGQSMSQPFDMSKVPPAAVANEGMRKQITDAVYAQAKSRLDPDYALKEEQLRDRMLVGGHSMGDKGFDAGIDSFIRGKNDAYNQAMYTAIDRGGAEEARQFGMESQAHTTGMQDQAWLRALPLNELNQLRTGSQSPMPNFQGYSGSNVAPPPLYQANSDMSGFNTDIFNTKTAQNNSQNQAAMQAAAMAAMYAAAL